MIEMQSFSLHWIMQNISFFNVSEKPKDITKPTLTLEYLFFEIAFRTHFQCVVRTYDLKCVENANQLVSTQGKIHEYAGKR